MDTGLGVLPERVDNSFPCLRLCKSTLCALQYESHDQTGGYQPPVFLVERFWSSKLSGKSLRGLSGFLFWICANEGAQTVLPVGGLVAWS
jgi:hypothetical protein